MDRHDIPHGITAKHVAEMHQEDLKVQHLYGCKGMTYWCDDSRMTAFCLIEAPNRKALQDMHNHAHGDVPHSIIEVDGKIVESFLGRIEDPESIKSKELELIDETAFRFIMVASLENLYLNNGDSFNTKTELLNFKESIAGIIDDFDGRVVQSKSDCFLGSFTSVSKAVSCALEVQTGFKEFIGINNITNINLQIGLSAGVPVTRKESLFEDAIRVAERFCNTVKGQIVLSSEIKELYKSENSNVFVDSKFIKTLHPSDEKFLNILMDYTDSKYVFHMTDYFMKGYLHNSDVFGIMTTYYTFFNKERINLDIHENKYSQFLNQLRNILVDFIFTNGSSRINTEKLCDEIILLSTIFL